MIKDTDKIAELTVAEFKEFFISQVKEVLKNECDLLCTYEQACIMLTITKVTLYQHIHRCKLHPVKLHGCLQKFIRLSELNRFLTDKTLYTKYFRP